MLALVIWVGRQGENLNENLGGISGRSGGGDRLLNVRFLLLQSLVAFAMRDSYRCSDRSACALAFRIEARCEGETIEFIGTHDIETWSGYKTGTGALSRKTSHN